MQRTELILIHGAWHGPWCFSKLLPKLQANYEVITPTLPCMPTQQYPQITLQLYIKIIEELVTANNTKKILCGHSLAGLILCALASKYPEKINELIFISAFIPDNGQNLLSCSKEDSADMSAAFLPPIDKTVLTLSPDNAANYLYNTCDLETQKWAVNQLQPQKLNPFNDPVEYDINILKNLNCKYIECLQDKAVSIGMQRKMHQKLNCEAITLDSCHSPFLSMPEKLAEKIN